MNSTSDASSEAAIVEYLVSLGAERDQIPDTLLDQERLASDLVLYGEDQYSLRTLAEEAGLSVDEIRAGLNDIGVRVDNPDEVRFNESDVVMSKVTALARSTLLTPEEATEVLRVVGLSLSTIAEAGLSNYVLGLEKRTHGPLEMVRANAEMARLGMLLAEQLTPAFRHHLRQSIDRQRHSQSVEHPAIVSLAIGFVDLTGFTSLTQDLSADGIIALVSEFESTAHQLANEHNARVVKLIGDEVMFSAVDPAAACRMAIDLISAYHDRNVIPRAGLAHGSVVNLHGDYFGPVVNLAARLGDQAIPGEVLIPSSMAALLDYPNLEPAGRRMLRGFTQPVAVSAITVSG